MNHLPVILKPGKTKSIFLIFISTAFIILGISLLENNPFIGILNIVFFGICLLIFVINLIPNSSYMKIGVQGIEMKNLFKSAFIPWDAVSSFRTKRFFVNKMVVYDISEKLLENTGKTTRTGAFPDTYGMSPEKLAALLNEYKAKFTSV